MVEALSSPFPSSGLNESDRIFFWEIKTKALTLLIDYFEPEGEKMNSLLVRVAHVLLKLIQEGKKNSSLEDGVPPENVVADSMEFLTKNMDDLKCLKKKGVGDDFFCSLMDAVFFYIPVSTQLMHSFRE